MKGIIYTRVSSGEQVKGTSLEHQEKNCLNYCKEKDIEVIKIFKEEGESAKDLSLNNRQAFLDALEYCRKNKDKIDIFIVLRLNRFARNLEDHYAVRKILSDYKVTLHSVEEPIDNTPSGKFMEAILAATSEYDNAIRKRQCTDGMIAKIKQRIWPFKPPIGYQSPNSKKRGEKKTEPDFPDRDIAPIIKRALKEYSEGLYSQLELGRMMDKWGLKNIRGKKTSPQLVDRIVGRYLKFYAGILISPWTGEEIRGLHEPIISKELMLKIQLIRSGKANAAKREKYNPEFPLRRTILCSHCGRPLTGSFSTARNGARVPYYHCHNKVCPLYGKTIPREDLHKDFICYLRKITPRENFLKLFKATVLDMWKEKGKYFELEAQRYEKKLKSLENRKDRIAEMREDGSYTKEEFLERNSKVDNEIAATKISLSESRIEQFDIEDALTYAINFIRDLGRQWFDLNPRLRPRFQKVVFPQGISYKKGEGFGTAQFGLIFALNETFNGQKSTLVGLRGIEPRLPG